MLAKRYSLKPSDLKNDSLEDYQFNQLVLSIAMDEEIKQQKKVNKRRV